MCGLAGFFAYLASAQPVSSATLLAMRDHMRTRGPDGEGLWMADDARVGLAHRRLSIIDLSDAAAQPMFDDTNRYALVFNGEIYNFRALRAELEREGKPFRTESDSEVLLRLYAAHGSAMLPMLRGMFALAIWDRLERSLFLARDPFGIKPLYYANVRGCIRFASQVKALLCDPGISRDPAPAGLAGFHLNGYVPEPFSIYREVFACPSGTWIKVDAAGVAEPVRYASIAGTLATGRNRQPTDLRNSLLDSVRHHLVADVEVGAFLSGGIDSAALVGLMRDCGQERIRTCTLGFAEFDDTPLDEVPRARDLAAHYGVEHHVRSVGPDEFRNDLSAIFEAMDQPTVDGINSWFISKACKEMGLKVAMSGIGGDEILGGYSTFRTVPLTHRLLGPVARLPMASRGARMLMLLLLPEIARRNPKMLGLLDYSRSWAGAYMLRRAVLLPFELADVMDPTMMAEGLAELHPLRLVADTMVPDPGSDMGRVAALEASNYLRNQLLRDADWAGMAHSLEIRVPLIDYTLLGDLAPLLPTLSGKRGKSLLANAPSRPVPPEIAARSKTGFAIPVGDWLSGQAHHVEDRRDSRRWAVEVARRYFTTVDRVTGL
jgi:asparagine synthase (glutamine-hydrolysing)